MITDNFMLVRREFDTHLSSVYIFENFINCEENMIAFSAAKAVAYETEIYNPLFIYGESGTGKTHLLHAIGNHIYNHYSNMTAKDILKNVF